MTAMTSLLIAFVTSGDICVVQTVNGSLAECFLRDKLSDA